MSQKSTWGRGSAAARSSWTSPSRRSSRTFWGVATRRAGASASGLGGGLSPLKIVAVAALAFAAFAVAAPRIWDDPPEPTAAGAIIAYTAPGETDGRRELPAGVVSALLETGRRHGFVELVRLEGTGAVAVSQVDLTPYLDGDDTQPVLTVDSEIDDAVRRLIAERIDAPMNTPTTPTTDRATYLGLVNYRPSAAVAASTPLYVVSSLLDTAQPVDLRVINWSPTQADRVVTLVRESQDVPAVFGGRDVTFVVAPTAGPQTPLRPGQTSFVESLWRQLAQLGGPASVTFDYGSAATAAVTTEPIPPVTLPDVPSIQPEPDVADPRVWHCQVPVATYFTLVSGPEEETQFKDRAGLAAALRDCVAALEPGATITVDGYARWEYAMDADGRPVTDGYDLTGWRLVSERRAALVAEVLTVDLQVTVPVTPIGHGVEGLPYLPASDERNACALITITNPD